MGTRTYQPPGWLRETILALQAECSAPNCRIAARLCDLDHTEPFPRGPTDVDNLRFASRHHHGGKTQGHWQVTALPDGTKRWAHPRSGLTTDVPLATRPLHAPPHQPPKADLAGDPPEPRP